MNTNTMDNRPASSGTTGVPRLTDPDAYFSMLTDACRDLDARQGHLFHAQLVLVLMHHVETPEVLREAIAIARNGLDESHAPG